MLTIKKVTEKNLPLFFNLSQQYEAEFCRITKKLPNGKGLYKITSPKKNKYEGWIARDGKQVVGFAVIDLSRNKFDVAEFYIVPAVRKQMYGHAFAVLLFDSYPGSWQVRQIKGAEYARDFWVAVIKRYTSGVYKSSTIRDSEWGAVYIQIFSSNQN